MWVESGMLLEEGMKGISNTRRFCCRGQAVGETRGKSCLGGLRCRADGAWLQRAHSRGQEEKAHLSRRPDAVLRGQAKSRGSFREQFVGMCSVRLCCPITHLPLSSGQVCNVSPSI